jgi:hypothetical protein
MSYKSPVRAVNYSARGNRYDCDTLRAQAARRRGREDAKQATAGHRFSQEICVPSTKHFPEGSSGC